MEPADPFRVLSPALLADPYSVYRQLRSEAPVRWSESWQGWVVTRYDDAQAILLDKDKRFSASRTASIFQQLPATAQSELQDLRRYMSLWIGFVDDPEHARQRAVGLKALAPQLFEAMRPQIQAVIDRLLDKVQVRGEMDAIWDFAYPLPATVIADLIGIPLEHRVDFKAASDEFVLFAGPSGATVDGALRAQQALRRMMEFLRPVYADRRRHRQQDFMTVLMNCEAEGMLLDEDEVIVLCAALAIGGHETTTNLIGNGLLALLRNMKQMEQLRARPELIASAVEELLRFDSPLQRQIRLAREDLELRGQAIRRGQFVLPFLGAANRDPEVFSNPDQLVLDRAPNRHLAFGYGPRFCLGAPLARLEGQLAFQALLQRFPDLRLREVEPHWHPNLAFRGLKTLPVAF